VPAASRDTQITIAAITSNLFFIFPLLLSVTIYFCMVMAWLQVIGEYPQPDTLL